MSCAELLQRAIAFAGSEAKLAEKAGFSQAAINKAKRADIVSADMAMALERATGINRHEWRPDYWPVPVRVEPSPADCT